MARAASSVRFIFLLACSLYAQESPCTRRIIPVGVLDSHGEVPRELSVNTFSAELDHKPLAITAATLFSGPNRVAILLDTSESMKEGMNASGKAELAYWVAADAVKRLPASVSIALLGFDKQVDGTLDFSASREQLTSELTQRKKALSSSIGRKTALRDAIEYVLEHIPNAAPGDAIYVIMDGEDNRSQIESAQLEDRLQRASVRLDVFLLRDFLWNGDPFPGSDDTAKLARATGGTVIDFHPTMLRARYSSTTENFTVSPARQELVSAALTLLYRQTASPYLLGIELPGVLKRSRGWKLNVVDQQLRKSISLSYPRQIGSCPSGQASMPN